MTITANKRKQIKRKTGLNQGLFSPSVNIIRDVNTPLSYIPTPNSRQVLSQLINNYKTGIRSFSIVGAYGTGKSSFLWAFEKTINGKRNYFPENGGIPKGIKRFDYLPIVGEFGSLTEVAAKSLGINKKDISATDVFRKLDSHCLSLLKSSKGLLIAIDEFGKFLEYASQNNPEREIYFIQQLAEYANDHQNQIILIVTLHRDFNGYARGLTKNQQNEWDKVKGRLKEITFNEPVEQLLYLASEKLADNSFKENHNFSHLFKAIGKSKSFPLRDYFNETIARKLLPLDILAASLLTLALQKYGQNERSLFSFLDANDHLGIKDYHYDRNPYYNISCVYDYLIYNYYSFLASKYNPHYTQWAAIRTALERTEGLLEEDVADAIKIVKCIGLLNIFALGSSRIDQEFLDDYSKYSMGIEHPEKQIKTLERLKIIRYVKHSNKYVIFEGTDLDIELAIDAAGNLVERVTNVVHYLTQYFDFHFIPAKATYYKRGTPRFFAFHLSETIEVINPENEIDGFVHLIFSDAITEEAIRKASKECDEAILFGWYKNTDEIKNLVFEIEKIKKVRENHSDDRVAVRELESIYQYQIKLLNHYVLGSLYAKGSPIIWYYKGKQEIIENRRSFNRLLTTICDDVYYRTPVFRNEMINRTKLSVPISMARKNLIKALVQDWNKKNLNFEDGKFPPEKTIYLSLLRETGIHRETSEGFILGEPTDESFKRLWNVWLDFLQNTKHVRRGIRDFIGIISKKPFRLKQGLIDFWLPVCLFVMRDDYALFYEGRYIPFINDETLELVTKNPKDYSIKAFDLEGVKLNLFNRYRSILNQIEQRNPTGLNFIETIRPFLLFYRDLPEYTKTTRHLGKKTLALREAIAFAKDPEETFFESFPKALEYSIPHLRQSKDGLEKFAIELQQSIKELRTCFEELMQRIEIFLSENILGTIAIFPEYKIAIQNRFKGLKKHLLLPTQRVFYQRVMSELDDRNAWLSSIGQACIGKSPEAMSDKDEGILFDRLVEMVYSIDNLCDISKADVDEEIEDVFKLEITSFVEGIQKNLVRLPKKKSQEVTEKEKLIRKNLGNDKNVNITVLIKLLCELLHNEK